MITGDRFCCSAVDRIKSELMRETLSRDLTQDKVIFCGSHATQGLSTNKTPSLSILNA